MLTERQSARVQALVRSRLSRRGELTSVQERNSLLRRKALNERREVTRYERQHRDATAQRLEANAQRVLAGSTLGELTARARAAGSALPIVTRTLAARELERRGGRHDKPANL